MSPQQISYSKNTDLISPDFETVGCWFPGSIIAAVIERCLLLYYHKRINPLAEVSKWIEFQWGFFFCYAFLVSPIYIQ